eukprot:495044-Prorocentrum_minimum.AAC.1
MDVGCAAPRCAATLATTRPHDINHRIRQSTDGRGVTNGVACVRRTATAPCTPGACHHRLCIRPINSTIRPHCKIV